MAVFWVVAPCSQPRRQLSLGLHLSALASLGGGGRVVLGGSTEDMVEQYLLWCFTVSIGGGVGRFVPVVMVVERGDATMCVVFFNNKCLTVNSVTLYCASVR
jgi:hypothetical protein